MAERQAIPIDIEQDDAPTLQSKALDEPESLLARMRALKERISPTSTLNLVQSDPRWVQVRQTAAQKHLSPDGTQHPAATDQPTQLSIQEIRLAFEQKRKALRNRCLRSGKVVFHDRRYSVDCQIRDESAFGMRLRIMGTVDVPNNFELLIESKESLLPVEVRWRDNLEVGVEIVGDPIPLPRKMIMDTSRRRFDT